MKATGKLLAAATLAAAAMLVTAQTQAADRGHRGSGASSVTRGAQGANRGASSGHRWSGQRHWSGSGQRHWSGSGQRHWSGSGHRYWHGSRWGFYYGVPLFLGAAWGWPYYSGHYGYYDYPRSTVIYRDAEPYPQSFPEGEIGPAASTEIPRGEGTPSRGPLYMNYCESAKAYFPKVTTCPEGWRLATPTN